MRDSSCFSVHFWDSSKVGAIALAGILLSSCSADPVKPSGQPQPSNTKRLNLSSEEMIFFELEDGNIQAFDSQNRELFRVANSREWIRMDWSTEFALIQFVDRSIELWNRDGDLLLESVFAEDWKLTNGFAKLLLEDRIQVLSRDGSVFYEQERDSEVEVFVGHDKLSVWNPSDKSLTIRSLNSLQLIELELPSAKEIEVTDEIVLLKKYRGYYGALDTNTGESLRVRELGWTRDFDFKARNAETIGNWIIMNVPGRFSLGHYKMLYRADLQKVTHITQAFELDLSESFLAARNPIQPQNDEGSGLFLQSSLNNRSEFETIEKFDSAVDEFAVNDHFAVFLEQAGKLRVWNRDSGEIQLVTLLPSDSVVRKFELRDSLLFFEALSNGRERTFAIDSSGASQEIVIPDGARLIPKRAGN